MLPKATTELQRQLTFTTSSTKKRKLSPQHTKGQEYDNSHDIPLKSVEDRESQSPSDLPRFDLPSNEDGRSDSAIPPHIPAYLQNYSSLATSDYISSAASSPSAAYAGLSIEGERGADPSGSDIRRGSLEPTEQDTRRQSPLLPFSHRSIMGGAADLPQRSSSPLKRRASDLEAEVLSSQQDDVDMIQVPVGSSESVDAIANFSRPKRAQSIDMLKEDEGETDSPTTQDSASGKAEDDIPDIDAQISTVTTLCQAALQHQLKDGDKVWLVSRTWLNRVIARGSEARKTSKMEPEGEIGPVDNSDIIKEIFRDSSGKDFVQLKHGIGSESFELFPQEAWGLVVQWYGLMSGSIPIIRSAYNTNPDKNGIPNIVYEYHPPVFKIHRLWGSNSNTIPQLLKAQNPPALTFAVNRSDRYMDFLKTIKIKAGIDLNKKVRVWRVPRRQPAAEPIESIVSTATPPSSRPSSPAPIVSVNPSEPQDSWTHMLLDVRTFTQLRRGDGRELIEQPDDQTGNPNYNGRSDLGFVGLGDDQAIVLDEQIDSQNYVSTYVLKGQKTGATTTRNATSSVPQSQTNSGRNSPNPYNLRGRTQKTGRTIGSVGLSNLGNTCYMNSALQCVRSVEELTKYFLTGVAEHELNADNPLGNNGEVAMAYANLLREMYKDPPPTSVTPRHFKSTIGRYAPSFSGYAQQDSQEFLGFLLDGLQEDLSRVKKKPYIEKPDSTDEMVNNPAAIREMAAKVWDITKKRDDSVIADLFTGMYKSTLVCPVCSKVSITFDPFNNVTLQLPIENNWSHGIYFFPLNDKPIVITVDMDKQGSILAMKNYMSKKVGVPVERLFVAEEFKSKIYKIHDDWEQASEAIGANDNIIMFELECKPTNWPAPQKPAKKQKTKSMLNFGNNDSDEEDIPNWDSPLAKSMLVPVFHRRPSQDRNRTYRKPWALAPVPHYIILTPEEARSEDLIRRKILEKVATFSTHSAFIEDEETDASASDSIDPDLVLANGSDSSDESKIVTHSIDGEEGMVDIAMKESGELVSKADDGSSKPQPPKPSKPSFNTRRPKFLQPNAYLAPELQNLFTLGYFRGVKELVPTGWNQIDEDKSFPTLASRSPQLEQTEDSGTDIDTPAGQEGSETSDDNHFHDNGYGSTTRMNEEDEDDPQSSEDELNAISQKQSRDLPVRPAKNRVIVGQKGGKRRLKTYSKKGHPNLLKKESAPKSPASSNNSSNAPDEGPLVRLGEGIVVDWTEDAFDAMFEGGEHDTFRGRSTYTSIPTFEDAELTAKRTARAKRRKNGITLDDCLNEFGKEEILSEADTWYCPRCKEHRRATKKFELWKTPDILVMHLKRFSSSGWRRDKLDVLVEFPIENLDLTSRVLETEPGKPEIYDLIAVDDHWGGLGGGHYTAFAKSFHDGEWYEYNDSSVSKQKDPSRIVTASAYLLFYRRRSDVPLGGPRFQQIVNNYGNSSDFSEDDIAESGEDQSLVANSSHHGSSSALTGVGAAHRPANGSSSVGQKMIVNPQELDGLPAYQAHEENDPDAAPMLQQDVNMNEGIPVQSIEDEGIDLGFSGLSGFKGVTNVGLQSSSIHPTWDFSALNTRNNNFVSGTGSEADGNDSVPEEIDPDGSDIVQDASSASSGSRRGRLEDFDNAIAEDDGGIYMEDNPVPDIEDPDQIDNLTLHREILQHRVGTMVQPEFKISVQADDEVEEPATEIHVEEGEGIKLD